MSESWEVKDLKDDTDKSTINEEKRTELQSNKIDSTEKSPLPNPDDIEPADDERMETGLILNVDILRRNEMIDHLASNKKAHFKSQQRGEPDLSLQEKKHIASSLFDKSPSQFLTRFGPLLTSKYLDYFRTFQYCSPIEKEEVEYHLSYLCASSSKSKVKVKNRRYDALQKMISSGSYFHMEEMQARNPLLYEQLVGKYQTAEEKESLKDKPQTDSELPLMQYFELRMEKEEIEKLKKQQEIEEASDGDEDSSEGKDGDPVNLWGEYGNQFHSEQKKKISKNKNSKGEEKFQNFEEATEEEKSFYLQEFQTTMYHSFLSGKDKDFDYSTVDNNSEYDCVDMRERDEQDEYFDNESPDADSGPHADAVMEVTEAGSDADDRDENSVPALIDKMEDEPTDDDTDARDRLTDDDVQNLKDFASSWAGNHVAYGNQLTEEQLGRSNQVDSTEKDPAVSLHKLPVKKNHKIKITLKSTKM